MRSLFQAFSIARKDLRIELRTKESLNAAVAFSVVVLLLFSFAFDPAADVTHEISGGLLWLVFAFAGALVFNRAFVRELPNECLDTLLSSPLTPTSILIGKAAANFILLLFLEAISLVVFGLFYNVHWWLHPVELTATCALATWGISILGAVFGALTVNLRLRELMLPVIIYPLLIPLLIAVIELTGRLFTNEPLLPEHLLWARLLVVFDVVFTALALALAEPVLVN